MGLREKVWSGLDSEGFTGFGLEDGVARLGGSERT